jgi:hypothetical protein
MNVGKIVATAARLKLLSNPQIVDLVGTRIYRGVAPQAATYPYILIDYQFGGEIQMSPKSEFDTGYLITAVSPSQVQAESLADYITDTLRNQDVVYKDGYSCYTPVTEENSFGSSFFATTNAQTQLYWRLGAVYRFRGVRNYKD